MCVCVCVCKCVCVCVFGGIQLFCFSVGLYVCQLESVFLPVSLSVCPNVFLVCFCVGGDSLRVLLTF